MGFLTGESRPCDPTVGDFKRLIPRRNFNFGKGGAWGAVELAGRFSHTDLDTKPSFLRRFTRFSRYSPQSIRSTSNSCPGLMPSSPREDDKQQMNGNIGE